MAIENALKVVTEITEKIMEIESEEERTRVLWFLKKLTAQIEDPDSVDWGSDGDKKHM